MFCSDDRVRGCTVCLAIQISDLNSLHSKTLMVFMFYSKPLEIPCANTIARIIRPIQMVIDFIMPNQHTLY